MAFLIARLLATVFLLSRMMNAQVSGNANQGYPRTLWAPCEAIQRSGGVIKGPVLVAKNGGRAAKVRVESTLETTDCSNTTTLLIAANVGGKFFRIHPQLSQPSNGNGMSLVDWSPDGRLLLAEFWQWEQSGTDVGPDKRILLFAAGKWSQSEIDLAQFMADQEGRNCQLEFKLLGFTPDGEVAMRTDLTTDYDVDETLEDVPPAKRCIEKHQTWAVGPHTQKPEPLPAGFHAQRYSVTKSKAPATGQ
jgi:hypothetical protein